MTGHLISTPAALLPCGRCGRHVLACFSGGFRTVADPEPLGLAAEIAAWLDSRMAFDVIKWGIPERLYLEYRTETRIAAGRNYLVVASHGCPPGAARAIDPLQYPFGMPGKRKGKEAADDQLREILF
jgi:hypothetical protein